MALRDVSMIKNNICKQETRSRKAVVGANRCILRDAIGEKRHPLVKPNNIYLPSIRTKEC